MTRPAQALKVAVFISTAVGLRLDVVNGCGCDSTSSTQAVLTQMIITLQDAGAFDIPLAAVATLMATLTLLMLLPALIAMR